MKRLGDLVGQVTISAGLRSVSFWLRRAARSEGPERAHALVQANALRQQLGLLPTGDTATRKAAA